MPSSLSVFHFFRAGRHFGFGAAIDEVAVRAPSRRAVRTASMAVLPPPTTITSLSLQSIDRLVVLRELDRRASG